jgi:hypothetical protein
MQMLVYVVLAVVIYALLADRTDRAIEREMVKRRPGDSRVGLVEDFNVRPELAPRFGRLLRRHACQTTATEGSLRSPPTSSG